MRRILIILLTIGCLGGPADVQIANWPHGYKSAACMTFDTELATGEQTGKVANALKGSNATFFVVTAYFNDRPEDLEPLRAYEIGSMAWKQGKWEYSDLSYEFQLEEMQIADAWFEKNGLQPKGFRAPLLLSNGQTAKAAGEMGYAYDSSEYPGTMPYMTNGIVEIPLTLNFDTYWNDKSQEISTIPLYLAFDGTSKKDGLFTFYSHVEKASDNTQDLLDFMEYAEAKRAWVASAGEIAGWWVKRSMLELRMEGDLIVVRNNGDEPVDGVAVKISPKRGFVEGATYAWESEDATYAVLPVINPGEEVSVL